MDATALHVRAYLEFSVGCFDAALAALAEAIRHDPTNAHYWFDAGIVHWERGDSAEAGRSFRQAASLAPTRARAWFNAAAAELRRGDRPSAIRLAWRAVGADPRLALPAFRGFVLGEPLVPLFDQGVGHTGMRSARGFRCLGSCPCQAGKPGQGWRSLSAGACRRG